MKEYLSIGELASIFDISVQLLRHYDKVGVLVPEYRDQKTGHRKYRFDQMYRLSTIRYLRKVGYPLESIKDFLEINDFQEAIFSMRGHSEQLKKEYNELLITDNIIQKKLAFIIQEQQNIVRDQVIYKNVPGRYFTLIGKETSLFTNELFYFYPTIGFYTGQEKKFGAYLLDSPDAISFSISATNIEKTMLPAGEYACCYHFGPYKNIYDSINKLLEHENMADKADVITVITINIIDQFIVSDPEKYVSELRIFKGKI